MRGNNEIRLSRSGKAWICDCPMSHHNIPRVAGLVWHKVVKGKWATEDPFSACLLFNYADEFTKPQLQPYLDERRLRLAMSKATNSPNKYPSPTDLTYRNFQCAGIDFLIHVPFAWLADEMGLGKTIEVIGLLNALTPESVLIVCPASLKINWRNELYRWLTDIRSIGIVGNGNKVPLDDIVIVNYDRLRKCEQDLASRKWDIIIGDESHCLKNSKAQRTRAFMKLHAERQILMTGTPLLNRPEELWTSLKWLDPERWQNWFYFAQRYCGATRQRGRIVTVGGTNLGELNKKMRSSIMLRRIKKDVLKELPPKVRQIIEFPCYDNSLIKDELTAWSEYERHRKLLEELRKSAEILTNEEEYRARVRSLTESMRVHFTELAKMRKAVAMYKMPTLIAHLKSVCSEHKVVCFAYHRGLIEGIVGAFPEHCLIYGGTNQNSRQDIVNRFQNTNVPIFVGSMKAAGVGLNLFSSSHVVFCEQEWTPAIITQAEDRCHRIGQNDVVLVQHLVLEGSLDARMARMCVEKQEVIDRVLK